MMSLSFCLYKEPSNSFNMVWANGHSKSFRVLCDQNENEIEIAI